MVLFGDLYRGLELLVDDEEKGEKAVISVRLYTTEENSGTKKYGLWTNGCPTKAASGALDN
ncbi:hypothetical protein LXL04_004150 [Taraxacum kok-saghyz]